MKRAFKTFACLFLLSSLILTGCKKDDGENSPGDSLNAKQTDQAGSDAADDALEDVNDIISNKIGGGSSAGARAAAYNLPCGVVSIDSTSTNTGGNKVYSVKYGDKTKCGYKKKSGTVTFELTSGAAFKDTGAVYSVTFNDYTVEVLATGNTVTLNGTINVTNLNGGHIWQAVVEGREIVHKVRGTFNITYANNEVRSRSYYRKRTWVSTDSWAGLSFSVDGDTTINGVSGVSETGKTLENNYEFITSISTPLKWSNCGTTYAGPYVLKEGAAKMDVTVPGIETAYFSVEAGYYWDYNNAQSTPVKLNDCSSNAYKIKTVIGIAETTQYQLY